MRSQPWLLFDRKVRNGRCRSSKPLEVWIAADHTTQSLEGLKLFIGVPAVVITGVVAAHVLRTELRCRLLLLFDETLSNTGLEGSGQSKDQF